MGGGGEAAVGKHGRRKASPTGTEGAVWGGPCSHEQGYGEEWQAAGAPRAKRERLGARGEVPALTSRATGGGWQA